MNSLKLKSDELKSELKTLNDENVLLLEKVETLISSNIMLNENVFVLTLKVNKISTFDEVKKICGRGYWWLKRFQMRRSCLRDLYLLNGFRVW